MNISYNWLKDLIDIDLSAEETAAALTRVGLAVEGIQPFEDDFVLDIDLTSNRPDCLSHLGVARELMASSGKAAGSNEYIVADTVDAEAIPFPALLAPEIVNILAPEICHRFTARIIRGVKVGPSPQWLVDRLEAIGERSINNVADITNYVMLELGQPMHAFDLDKLTEGRIIVRSARPGETIKTLDEVERKLDETMLVICDAEKPVAIAGVMGGSESGITDTTTNVLIEVAYFRRDSVRQTSRKLNLATEASYRFERGVDIENLERASNRAVELIRELAGGEAADIVDIFPTRLPSKEVESRDISKAVKRLTGLGVSEDECTGILSSLGIDVVSTNPLSTIYRSPSWRHDIAIEEDLVEEIARHFGYESIADELPPAYGAGEYQTDEECKKRIRASLAAIGFNEAIGYSFIDAAHDGLFETVPGLVTHSIDEPFVTLCDSVIEGAVRMRASLLPGLLGAVKLNFNYQNRDIALFEIGKAFAADGTVGSLPRERELFALVMTGSDVGEGRLSPSRELDFFDAKGAVEMVLNLIGVYDAAFMSSDARHLRRGQAAAINAGGIGVGSVGRLNEEIAANYKFRQPVYVAEIDLQAVLAQKTEPVRYEPLPKYPSVLRDVSLLVKRDQHFASIRSVVETLAIPICQSVGFVDSFQGKGLADNESSLTIRVEYRSDERTLTEAEVNETHAGILAALESELGIRPRM